MNKLSIVVLAIAVVSLMGCDDKPSDNIASEAIRKLADNDAFAGVEVSNFVRANGQIEPNSANLYKVTYSYDLKLTKPFAEVVLMGAQAYQKQIEHEVQRETGAFLDQTALQNNLNRMQQIMTINQWAADQGDGMVKRRNALLRSCPPCLTWWNSEDVPKEAEVRRRAFLSAWIGMEQLGFKDGAVVGDSVPREAWAFFSKTEKGWQVANQ